MRTNNLPQGEKYIKEHRFHKRWHRAVMLLSAVVVCCTVYALILPAITMERTCQLPEHTHSDACYTQLSGDTLSAKDTPDAPDALTCTNTDADHVHTSRCYGTWVLTCGMKEPTHTAS